MSGEECQVADGLEAIISQTKIEELEDTEKAIRLAVNLLGAFLRGEQGIDAVHAARTLIAMQHDHLPCFRHINFSRAIDLALIGCTIYGCGYSSPGAISAF